MLLNWLAWAADAKLALYSSDFDGVIGPGDTGDDTLRNRSGASSFGS